MKKRIAAVLAMLLVLSGCAGDGGVEGTTAEIIEKIYANHPPMELHVDTVELDLGDADAVKYNTGLPSGEKIAQASVSEAMISQAYSLVVLRVKNPADAPKIAREIFDNANTRKWICVEADAKTVMYSGDVVVLFMVSEDFGDSATPESVQQAFRAVCGGRMTII